MRNIEDRQVISDGSFTNWFKDNYSQTDKYLYMLGVGFDERMCEGISRFSEIGIPFDVWEINYNEGETSPSKEYIEKVKTNKEQLDHILSKSQILHVEQKHIKLWQEDSGSSVKEDNNVHFVGEVNASKIVKSSITELESYSDIIIDVSALPQTIYLCIINTLFKCSTDSQRIYIVVNENYTTDMLIEPAQAEETAHEVQGYSSPSEELNSVIIWYPILGEVNKAYLEKYLSFLKSHSRDVDEICPVVPFPSVNIRRADSIISQYSKTLFDDWGVDKKNIIYASETNPILVCNNLIQASESYRAALSPLGESKFVFSAITSKLMTIGMLLAAFDLKSQGYHVSILGISNKGYWINNSKKSNTQNRLICLAV